MIRLAEKNDIQSIVKNGKDFHEYALKDKGLNYIPEDCASTMQFMIDNKSTTIFISETSDKEFIGTIAGIVHPWIMDFNQSILTEQYWWTNYKHRGHKDSLKLVDVFINWGKLKGASLLIMTSINSEKEKALKRYYKRRGFKYLETHFIKEI